MKFVRKSLCQRLLVKRLYARHMLILG